MTGLRSAACEVPILRDGRIRVLQLMTNLCMAMDTHLLHFYSQSRQLRNVVTESKQG